MTTTRLTAEQRAGEAIASACWCPDEDCAEMARSLIAEAIRPAASEAREDALPAPLRAEIVSLLRDAYVDEARPCGGDDPDCHECRAIRVIRALEGR